MFWLLSSFIFGTVGLIIDVKKRPAPDPDSEDNNWSFGQIMPVILLVLPFVTIIENLYPDEAPVRISHTEATTDVSSSPLLLRLDARHDEDMAPLVYHPDRDYYHICSSMKAGTMFIFAVEIFMATLAPIRMILSPSDFGNPIQTMLKIAFPVLLSALWCIILLSLGIEGVKAGRRHVLKWLLLVLLQSANVIVSMGCLGGIYILFMSN